MDTIVEALKAIQNILSRTPKFIEAAYPGIKVYESEIFIEHLESGSLDIEVWLRHVIGDVRYDQGAKIVDDASQLLKDIIKDKPVVNNLVVGATAALIGVGATLAMSSNDAPAPPAPVTIINYGVINQSGTVILSGDEVAEIIDKIPKKQLAKDAIDFAKPAKTDENASIAITGTHQATEMVKFEAPVLKAMPDRYEQPVQKEREKSHQNIDVYVFASDQDKVSSGWAGIVPDLFDNRVKFRLGEDISPNKLHGKRKIKADIIVRERYNTAKRAYETYEVEIIKTT